jgi:polyisoprenyl-teichoic acid--peptidoglycan teichoic acid transferase
VSSTSPIRNPDAGSPSVMGRRAWWLVALGILIPGSPQLLAGSRRLGRFAVGSTFVLWALAILGLALYSFWNAAFLTIATNVVALTIAQVGLVFYAVLWVILAINTMGLVRLPALAPAARIAVATLATAALVVTAGAAGYGAVVAGSARTLLTDVFGGGSYAEPIDGRYTVMLLGGDAGADRIGLRPDSISVVSIDAETGASTIIGIPRNLENNIPFVEGSPLWGPFPEGYNCGNECLISYLYTFGVEHPELYPDAVAAGSDPGVEAMRDAVEAVTGLTMQYYVLIDMQGFSQLIDSLGGITIDVEQKVLLGKNGEDPIGVIPSGTQLMDGATALWYARSRYNVSDYDRMARQRDVQEAIVAQFEPANVLTKFQAVAEAGAQVVKTDIPQSMLPRFVDLGKKAKLSPITTLELVPPAVETANPDIDAIKALIAQTIAASKPSVSPAP